VNEIHSISPHESKKVDHVTLTTRSTPLNGQFVFRSHRSQLGQGQGQRRENAEIVIGRKNPPHMIPFILPVAYIIYRPQHSSSGVGMLAMPCTADFLVSPIGTLKICRYDSA